MGTPAFRIQHGTLIDVTGRPVRAQEVTFVPAEVVLAGENVYVSHPLKDYMAGCQAEAKLMIKPHEDSPWTLGRILFLFGSHLLDDINEFRSELRLFYQSFIVVFHEMDNLSIPFCCLDDFCESYLMFSSEESLSTDMKDRIAKSFWTLLLPGPTDVEEYECGMLHSKIGNGRIRFGVAGGETFVIDTNK